MSSQTIRIGTKKLELQTASSTGGEPRTEHQIERRPGGWVLIDHADGRRERVFVWSNAPAGRGGAFTASLGGRLWHGQILEAESHGAGAESVGPGDDSDLVVQFPGKVRQVMVSAGAKIKAGDPLVLVEAMKMEFAIRAPRDARVAKVLVKEGQQVGPGDRLVELEDPK